MSVIFDLIKDFVKEEKFKASVILGTSIINNVIQSIGFSRITAMILTELSNKKFNKAQYYFTLFIYLSILYIGVCFVYRHFQNGLLSKLYQWTRFQLVRMLMVSNDEEFSNENFTSMISPINRVSSTTFSVLNDLITFYIPNIIFLLVSVSYILYQHISIGAVFITGNLIWIIYLMFNWKPLIKKNQSYEKQVNHTEKYLLEMLGNMDKIVARGQTTDELSILKEKKKYSTEKSFDFYSSLDNNLLIVNTIVLITTLCCIGIGIQLYRKGKFTQIGFVTFFTILLMYRDKVLNSINILPEFIETIGRSEILIKHLDQLQENYEKCKNKIYTTKKLDFANLELENVCFEFKNKVIFKDVNLHFRTTDHKIIGLTGPSGKGKSTMCKMFLKMYKCNKGTVYIDGVDIENVDPIYIRENITYVNQNSKLFDRNVLENILYGCTEKEYCMEKVKFIMQYPKIKELYKDIDLEKNDCGPMGEKLSGGQRQIVNIISGLINPSRIVILDEPTNALDKQLKIELLDIIKQFKKEKQAIIIITHDKDVYPMFDDHIDLENSNNIGSFTNT